MAIIDNYNAQGPGDAAGKRFDAPKPFYDAWQSKEGIPIHQSFHVDDLAKVELDMWRRFGVPAAFVNLADPFICTAMVLEIPPGGATLAVRHMFETWIFVVGGTGQTLIRQDGVKDQVIDWQTRSLFGPPLNATYRHSNTGTGPARILMVTNAPLTLNLYHNERFVFENPFVFKDRYGGEDDYFDPHHEVMAQRYIRTNMVKDVRDFYLHEWKERGPGARTVFLSMSHHTIGAHVSEFEVGTYKLAHRHGPSAHVIILQGEGYSLLWKEGEDMTRVDWRENSIFSPPDMWYHQHFNTGRETARYLALKSKGAPEHPCRIGAPGPNSDPDFAKLHQIESEDEDPAIYHMFAEELKRKGLAIAQPRPNYKPR
ncbi:MAG: ethanolamine ammonia lyase-activating protein [Alphaproteobacteria bacterium]|nr:ethanolamine ammonia lyase-activating protein [Alphaproteobacteria bacterium]